MTCVLPTSRLRREPVKKSVSVSVNCASRKLATVVLERMSFVARKRRRPSVLQERSVVLVRKRTDNKRSDVLADVTVKEKQEIVLITPPRGIPWIVASRMPAEMNVAVLAYTMTTRSDDHQEEHHETVPIPSITTATLAMPAKTSRRRTSPA